jgi:membrane associated rhomboid family serine protease
VTDAGRNPDDYCYRHPDRLSFVLCERCGRTICLECQNHVDGRVLCPDDASRSNVTMMPVNRRPKKQPRVRQTPRFLSRVSDSSPIATYVLAGISAILSILGLSGNFGILVQVATVYQARGFAPWQVFTASFINPSILGFIINTIVFVLFGRLFERMIGHGRFVGFFFIGAFGAAVGTVAFGGLAYAGLSPVTVAMAAAIFIMQRHVGRTDYYLLGILIFDVVINVVANGQWQAIVGSLLIGALVGFVYTQTDRIKEGRNQNVVLTVLAAVLVVVAASGSFIYRATS